MENLNRLVFEASTASRYATFFFGVYDPASRELSYVNAGHNPPMIFRGSNVLRLEEGGPVIGLLCPARYEQASVTLQSGDTMVLFTDGVSEAMNPADQEFDEARLMDAVRSGAALDASTLIDHIMKACDEFAAGAPQHDDMTLVVVRVK
jgi:sigma-B regulation protein RsbU (phosphoserine phosphatase)